MWDVFICNNYSLTAEICLYFLSNGLVFYKSIFVLDSSNIINFIYIELSKQKKMEKQGGRNENNE